MKLLLATITYSGMRYCRKEFIKHLSELDGNFDVLFVTNSGENDKKLLIEESSDLIKQLNKKGKSFTVIINDDIKNLFADQIVSNRNLVRNYFLKQDYDFLYFKDQDVFGPKHQIITALSHNKKLVTGYYMMLVKDKSNKIHTLPMIYVSKGNGTSMQLSILDVIPPRFFEISFAGLGCTLIARDVLEKISFRRFTDNDRNSTEDTAFYIDARKEGYKLYLDTRIKCQHVKWTFGDKRNAYLNPNNYKIKKVMK